MANEKTLVIGLGNPILGDDGVGWMVAEEVRQGLENGHVEVCCLSVGGLRLMERMVDYDKAIIIDAIVSGKAKPGSVQHFPLESLTDPSAGHTTSVHDTSLTNALQLGRTMKIPLPQQVEVVAIESESVHDFSEEITPAVAEAIPKAAKIVNQLIHQSHS